MDRRVKGLWTGMLRAHPEQQGSGSLGTTDGLRCCLGVLSDIAVAEGVIDAPTPDPDDSRMIYSGISDYLPPEVCAWAGLMQDDIPMEDPWVRVPEEFRDPDGSLHIGKTATLSQLNDAEVSFTALADIIEEQL